MDESRDLARELRDALRPLWRRMRAQSSVSVGKLGILRRLETDGAATASELSAAERVSPQAVAAAVRELEEFGLLGRTPDPDDRRRTRIELTPEGVRFLRRDFEKGQEWLHRAIAVELDDEERALLAAAVPLLRRLNEEVGDGA